MSTWNVIFRAQWFFSAFVSPFSVALVYLIAIPSSCPALGREALLVTKLPWKAVHNRERKLRMSFLHLLLSNAEHLFLSYLSHDVCNEIFSNTLKLAIVGAVKTKYSMEKEKKTILGKKKSYW